MRLRRRRSCYLRIRDERTLDFAHFFRGRMGLRTEVRCELLCPLRGHVLELHADELAPLVAISADRWTPLEEASGGDESLRALLVDLANRGILLADPPAAAYGDLAADQAELDAVWWDDLAAVYHAHSSWKGVDSSVVPPGGVKYAEPLDDMVRQRGQPPGHFPTRADATQRIELDVPDPRQGLFDVLRARRTSRSFRSEVPLPAATLAEVLHAVFGVQGIRRLSPDIAALRRTSPSAGAMHPVEAYVLALNVEHVPQGLYHYEGGAHSLALLEGMEEGAARECALQFVASQDFFARAHVIVIHVARFDRNFWKYPRHKKAYKAVLMDAAHLSQTLYLVATQLGLGAFFTTAINDADIADRLKLDHLREAPVAINGFGIRDPDDALEFKTGSFAIERRSAAEKALAKGSPQESESRRS